MRTAAPALLAALALPLVGCGGKSLAEHQKELYMQRCAACHGIGGGHPTPIATAPDILTGKYTVEQVRRAVIDGRPGMPKGLLGGSDVDEIATYLSSGGNR